ncbi:uncharacterized protein LOC131146345 [Malania oleifera]|uniref:uncharacterized protein LOC131146345 n=1 Tax=Malania oleifera TaxID=397392 RepID=UPI0025AE1067|nr:uncharacterized protein LOC131146345 [Malania oleifera]XP_057951892.1 uncharacterized protein LOC131146345 [Malania oleifera]XP_057951893.1 uncharacterized protein LOC131146345 [Malania oleifera]
MENSGAILCQISSLKDMLDRVNEEIEASIQITRDIESEIVKISELESSLEIKESELTKMVYALEFEINGLMAVIANSRTSVRFLEKELCCLRMKQDETLKRMRNKREIFTSSCLNFQRGIDKEENDELRTLLLEKECLQNEIQLLDRKNNSLRNSMLAFMEEILEDLCSSNSALYTKIGAGNWENEKLQKDIDELKTTLISIISTHDD